MKNNFCIISLLFFSYMASPQTPAFVSDSLDTYILKGLKDWDVPGLSMVIVKDGKPVIMKGFGVKNVETQQPVDQNTLFMIASNTKLFTGTALALLEHWGKLSLNDKITKYFPDFKLFDKNSTELVTNVARQK